MPGRAAMMMKLPGWNPVVIASMSWKPAGQTGAVAAHVKEPVDVIEGVFHQTADRHETRFAAALTDRIDQLLGRGRGRRSTSSSPS